MSQNTTENSLPENTQLCMNQTETSWEILTNYKAGEEKPSKNILCFMKCMFEDMGFLPNNTLCIESMKKKDFPKAAEETRINIYKCLENVEKILSCEDMISVDDCFNKY